MTRVTFREIERSEQIQRNKWLDNAALIAGRALPVHNDPVFGVDFGLCHGDARIAGIFDDIVSVVTFPVKASITVTKTVVNTAADVVAKIPVVGKPISTVIQVPGLTAIEKALQGERIDRAIMSELEKQTKIIRETAPLAAAIVGLVPGVGTGVAAGLAAAAALINGQPIDQALIAAVKAAIPGGALAVAVFDISRAAIEGKNLTGSILAALPAALTSQVPNLGMNVSILAQLASGVPMVSNIATAALKAIPFDLQKALTIGVALAQAQKVQRETNEALKAPSPATGGPVPMLIPPLTVVSQPEPPPTKVEIPRTPEQEQITELFQLGRDIQKANPVKYASTYDPIKSNIGVRVAYLAGLGAANKYGGDYEKLKKIRTYYKNDLSLGGFHRGLEAEGIDLLSRDEISDIFKRGQEFLKTASSTYTDGYNSVKSDIVVRVAYVGGLGAIQKYGKNEKKLLEIRKCYKNALSVRGYDLALSIGAGFITAEEKARLDAKRAEEFKKAKEERDKVFFEFYNAGKAFAQTAPAYKEADTFLRSKFSRQMGYYYGLGAMTFSGMNRIYLNTLRENLANEEQKKGFDLALSVRIGAVTGVAPEKMNDVHVEVTDDSVIVRKDGEPETATKAEKFGYYAVRGMAGSPTRVEQMKLLTENADVKKGAEVAVGEIVEKRKSVWQRFKEFFGFHGEGDSFVFGEFE